MFVDAGVRTILCTCSCAVYIQLCADLTVSISVVSEADAVGSLRPLAEDRFGYALANGIVGVHGVGRDFEEIIKVHTCTKYKHVHVYT